LSIPRGIGSKALHAAFEKQDLQGKWSKTSWAKKFEQRAKRAALNDFDRFKVMLARKKKSTIVGKGFAKLRNKQ
jgi:large subunit ribosomal protein L14e